MSESNQGHNSMVVEELRAQLADIPDGTWVDCMFPDGSDAYPVKAVDLIELSDGRQICVLDMTADKPLKAV